MSSTQPLVKIAEAAWHRYDDWATKFWVEGSKPPLMRWEYVIDRVLHFQSGGVEESNDGNSL